MDTYCPSLQAAGITQRRASPSTEEHFLGVPDLVPRNLIHYPVDQSH